MIHKIMKWKKSSLLATLILAIFVIGAFAELVYAATVVDGSYTIAVSGSGNIDLDGTDNVLVYLAYNEEGQINSTLLNLTFQVNGGTDNLLPAEYYEWNIICENDNIFQAIPILPEGTYSYSHSFNINPNLDANGDYLPSVKKAEVTVSYDGIELAHKSIYVVTPISMNGFDTEYPSITSSYIALRRDIDNLDAHKELPVSKELNISTVSDEIMWYYRPLSSNDDEAWIAIPKDTADPSICKNEIIQIRTYAGVNGKKVEVKSNTHSGGITVVGRIEENEYYSETIYFDVIVAAYSRENDPNGQDALKDMVFGEEVLYNTVVQYKGDMNILSVGDDIGVVKYDDINYKFIANYFGSVQLEFSPVESTGSYAQLYNSTKCDVTANVLFDIIKAVGNSGWVRIVPGSKEVISVGSSVTLMTNVKAAGETSLVWTANDDGSIKTLDNYQDGTGCIKATPINAATYSSGYTVFAREGNELEIECGYNNPEVIDGVRDFTLIITDGMTIEPSSVELSVGDAVNIQVETTNKKDTVYWEIVDSAGEPIDGYVSFTSDPTGKTIAKIVANKAGTVYITATQSTHNTTISARCKVVVSESLEKATLYGEISEGKIMLAQGETIELDVELWDSIGNPFIVTEDDIKWESLQPSIAGVDMDPYDPTHATITALNVGKAYVAVVANDTSQTQIDVVEVIVVPAATGVVLSEHNVEDSLNNKTYRLTATVLPEGAEELEMTWTSSDTSIATVNENGVVTYLKAGEVVITVMVGKQTDSCILKIITPVSSITLNTVEESLMVGEIFELIPMILPDNATHKEVVWESSDTRIATVDENGLVTAVGSGTANIKCSTPEGDVSAICRINVYQQVRELQLNYDKLTVRKGTILWLYASVIPDTAIKQELTWSSSNPEVAVIDEFGQITALAAGTTTITVTSVDTGASDTCELTVSESVTGISLNIREETIDIGEKLTIIPTVTPVEAENKEVTFTSSDPTVATVTADGIVTGIKGGTVVITCKTVERGLIASCLITVNQYITDISFVEKELYIIKGEHKTLKLNVVPETANVREFEWKSQDSNIVAVDESGIAHGINYGTVIITVTTTDGTERRATCKVTVVEPVTSVKITESKIEVEEGKSHQLSVQILPQNASIQNVIWTSSDTSIAKVDNRGKVTGVKEGVCTITATAEDGNGAYGKCEVTVTKTIPVTSITVNPQDAIMIVGESRLITARMKPTNTTEKYSWVSSDTSVAVCDSKGNVTAVGTGTATITAVTDITGTEGSFKVTVIALNTTKVTLEQYDTYDLYLDGMTGGITWYSKNKRVVTVNADGQIVARQAGTTSIVARINGKRVTCEVTVVDMP